MPAEENNSEPGAVGGGVGVGAAGGVRALNQSVTVVSRQLPPQKRRKSFSLCNNRLAARSGGGRPAAG